MGEQARKRGDVIQVPTGDSHGSTNGGSERQQTPAATARYVSEMVRELRILSEGAGMPFLAYLLDLAHEEAEAQSRRRIGD